MLCANPRHRTCWEPSPWRTPPAEISHHRISPHLLTRRALGRHERSCTSQWTPLPNEYTYRILPRQWRTMTPAANLSLQCGRGRRKRSRLHSEWLKSYCDENLSCDCSHHRYDPFKMLYLPGHDKGM